MSTNHEISVEGSVVRVGGEIDLLAAPVLRSCISSAAANADEAIVIDLHAVTFLDSSGLNELIRCAVEGARDVVLQRPSERVRRVLELTGVCSLFTLVEQAEA